MPELTVDRLLRVQLAPRRRRHHACVAARRVCGAHGEPHRTPMVSLPPAPTKGVLPITVGLAFDQVGVLQGSLAEPSAADAPGARLPAQPVEPVTEATAPGEACVAGGWFWMGDPRLPPEGERTANVPRLVHVASFCVDDHEVTVRELRASGVDTAGVVKWSGNRLTSNLASFCAYTEQRGANDERAVNCVPWTTARQACIARGMDLPTEAQLEYLGTALGRSPFVWGREVPACEDAILARSVPPLQGDESCARGARESTLPATVAEVAATRDVIHLSALASLSSPPGGYHRGARLERLGMDPRGLPARQRELPPTGGGHGARSRVPAHRHHHTHRPARW